MSRSEKWLFATPLLIVLAFVVMQAFNQVIAFYRPEKLVGHTDSVYAVKFSPDGKFLATGSDDGTIRVWDVQSKVAKYVINWPGWWSNIDFSPDGKVFATGGRNKNVTLWDTETGRQIKSWAAHNAGVKTVIFSPTASIVASSGWDGSIKVWDKTTGRLLKTLIADCVGFGLGPNPNKDCGGKPITFSPAGDVLAVSDLLTANGQSKSIIRFWNTKTFRGMRTFVIPNYENIIVSFCFSPDGKRLALCADVVIIFDLESGQIISKMDRGRFGLKFFPDGKKLAGTKMGGEPTVDVFTLDRESPIRTFSSCDNLPTNYRLDISPDGRTLAFGDYSETNDTKVELWKIGDG